MDSFGKRLKVLRSELKLSQEEISRKLGISTHSYLNYENDMASPKISLLKKLRELFNVNINWLVDGSGYMFDTLHFDEIIVKDPRFQDFFYWLNKYPFVQLSTLYNFEECKLKHPDKFLTRDQEAKGEKK